MKEIIYIQKYIYKYKNDYVIIDKDLSKLLNINVSKLIKKYKKLFNINYCYKLKDNYLLKQDGIVLISLILNSFYIVEITSYILDTLYTLEKINDNVLNKISMEIFL